MKPRTLIEERAALDKALDEFTNDCRARLYEMADMLLDARKALEHGDRYHLHDIANRAMMLWWQTFRSPNKENTEKETK